MGSALKELHEQRRDQIAAYWRGEIARYPQEIPDPEEPAAITRLGRSWIDTVLRMARYRHSVRPYCESPIEEDFAVAFLHLMHGFGRNVVFRPNLSPIDPLDCDVLLGAQFRLRRFRYDFVIGQPDRGVVLVECDGAAWHSAPEQVANDKRKDEAAREEGYALIRFSGKDLRCQADACARLAAGRVGIYGVHAE